MDVPATILAVTREIWEDRGVATLTRHYAPDIVVRSPASIVVGNQGVIAATLATLHEFPDRQLYGEDVIWCDAPNGAALSSHRLICTATHTRKGAYGAPTGRRLRYRILADCHLRADGQIDDEWLVRDQGAIAVQLGLTAEDYARRLIAQEGGPDRCVQPFTPARDVAGPYGGQGNDDPLGARHADIVTEIMAGNLGVIPKSYDRACWITVPGGVEDVGTGAADAFWLGLRAAFPDAAFEIHHVIGRSDPGMPPRSALRWSLTGTHGGWGRYGRPTGAPVHVMGISHAEFGALCGDEMRLRRDWTLLDDTAIWKQILLHTGAL
ncbi:MAG: ester cyclase [Pseudomonadota bacterium]